MKIFYIGIAALASFCVITASAIIIIKNHKKPAMEKSDSNSDNNNVVLHTSSPSFVTSDSVYESGNVTEENTENTSTKEFFATTTQSREIQITEKGFTPDKITINKGRVQIHITALGVRSDIIIPEFRFSAFVDEGKTLDVGFEVRKSGTLPFFCKDVCPGGQKKEGIILVL